MLVVYVVLLACIVFAHILIYWLIKAGIEDSKKPTPLSARQRRSVAGPSCGTAFACRLLNLAGKLPAMPALKFAFCMQTPNRGLASHVSRHNAQVAGVQTPV